MPRVHGLSRLGSGRLGNRLAANGGIGSVGAVVGVGGVIQKEGLFAGIGVGNMPGEKADRVIGMAAAEFGEDVCVGRIGGELFSVTGGGDRLASMNMAGTDFLFGVVSFALRSAGRIGTGCAVRPGRNAGPVEAVIKRRCVERAA